DHPEFRQVARRVRVLRAEGRTEGVDVTERQGEDLALELAAHREVGGLTKKILREVDRAVGLSRRIREVEGGDAEHRPRSFAVRSGDDRRVYVDEAPFLEKLVDRERQGVSHAEDSSKRVRARA